VNKSYIKDKFNLYDLNNLFESDSSYKEALKIILDEATIRRTSAASSQENAEMLYGMIHSRYIKCAAGLEAMRRKYVRGDFGTCPRHGCRDQLAIPVSLSIITFYHWICKRI
jgi:casein kinase II subunit beta